MKKSTALTTLFALALVLAPLGPAAARQPGQQPTPAPPPTTTAQRTQPAPTPGDEEGDVVRITSNLVQVDVVVTDKQGRQVNDLTAEDFEIREDGKPRAITNFSYVSVEPGAPAALAAAPPKAAPGAPSPPVPPAPLRPEQVRRTIALVVDDLGTSFESMHLVRQALRKFVDEQVRPGDLVAIMRTSAGMGALQQFTSDKRRLHAAIERVRFYPGRSGVSAFEPVRSDPFGRDAGPVTNRDSSAGRDDERERRGDRALDELREQIFSVGTLGALNFIVRGMGELPGRKAVVMFSEGAEIYDPNNLYKDVLLQRLRRLTDQANRAAVAIYTVDARGVPAFEPTAADELGGNISPQRFGDIVAGRRSTYYKTQQLLDFLSRQTGGVLTRGTNELSRGVQRALDELSGYYLVGYRPDASTFDLEGGRPRFRDLSVKVRRPGLIVRARKGFFGLAEAERRPGPRTRFEQVKDALVSPFGATGVPLHMASVFLSEGERQSHLESLVHIDVSGFKFTEEPDGWHKAAVDVVALTFNADGEIVDEVNRTETLSLRGQTFERARRQGLLYSLRVPVKKPGAYQLRVVIRDAGSERAGSASQFVEVPDLGKNRLALSGIILRGHAPEAGTPGAPPQQGAAPATPGSQGGAEASDPAPLSNAAVRRFRQGSEAIYVYQIFNARIDRTTGRPKLQTQVRLFRDGQQVFAGEPQDYDPAGQADPKRLQAGALLRLNKGMPPGEYVLQIVVTDLLAKEDDKSRVATQWIDFEVVK